MNEDVKNAKEPKDSIFLIKKYQDLWKEQAKIYIYIVGKQGKLLKRFKDRDEFFDLIGLSRFNMHFKIGLYKFLCKFPVLKNWTLTSSYFKNNFTLINKVCNANADIFGGKK